MSCEWQPVVGQSERETEGGKLLRFRCIHCGFVTEPVESPLYRDEYLHRECPVPHSGRVVIQPPNILTQYANFARSLTEHIAKGMPASEPEEVVESFRICSACPLYSDLSGQCCECGCYVNLALHYENLNMLAWAEKECPLGKWQSPLRRRENLRADQR